MTTNEKAKITLDSLTQQYNEWAKSIQYNPRQLQGVYLSTEYGYVYVRNMARGVLSGYLVVCLATISFDEDIQNQGILSKFINHIENNPFGFYELEIESIQVQFLVDSLLKKDFKTYLFNPAYPLPVNVVKDLQET